MLINDCHTRVGAFSIDYSGHTHIFDSLRLLKRKTQLNNATLAILQDAAENCDKCRNDLDLLLNCLACGH